jgi:hypothetical protein
MEPKLQTVDYLLGVQQELIALEPIFHQAGHGITRAAREATIAEEFWEIGASGRRYGRKNVLDTLEERYSRPYKNEWTAEDFYCQEIAAENYLLTYTLKQGFRVTRRATIWRRAAHGWVIVFHQGTVVEST